MGKIRMNVLAALLAVGMNAVRSQGLTSPEEIIDVGRVEYCNPVTASFELRNNGNSEIRIEGVRTNCGCVVTKLRHKTIGRGKSMMLSATYDARQLGHFEKTIGICMKGIAEPYLVTMKGIVVADLDDFNGVYDYRLGELDVDRTSIEFDDVNRGDMPIQRLHIRNNTNHEVEPVVMHMSSYLSATVSPQRIAPGRTGVATITLDSRGLHDYGLTQTAVYLGAFPGDTVSADKEIEVSTILLPAQQDFEEQQPASTPRIGVAPPSLDLGVFGKRKRKSGTVLVKNEGGAPLEIRSVQVFTPGLDVSLGSRMIAPGAIEKIKVTAHRDLLQNARTQPRILMITNEPENPKVVITVKIE